MPELERTRDNKQPQSGPKVIRITPEGRREVDPMTIIGSTAARKHLEDIEHIGPQQEPTE